MKKRLLDNADVNKPSLTYAVELQKLAARQGFDWTDIQGVIAKIHEELDEVLAEVTTEDNAERLSDEIGDLLFACTNLARHLQVDPNQALIQANQKFYRRFSAIESLINQKNSKFSDYTLSELDNFWNEVKNQE